MLIYAYHGQIRSQEEQRNSFTNIGAICICAVQGRVQGDDNVDRKFVSRGRCRYAIFRVLRLVRSLRRILVKSAADGIRQSWLSKRRDIGSAGFNG